MTLTEWAPEYLRSKAVSHPLSYDHIEHHIQMAVRWFGHLEIDDSLEVQDQWAQQFIVYQDGRLRGVDPGGGPKAMVGKIRRKIVPVSVRTINDEWRDIRAALFRAARTGGTKKGNRWNLCNSSPIANLNVAGGELGEEREIHTFHPDELHAIYAEEPETAPIWEFCVNTGLRQAEARHQLQRYVDKGSDLPQCRLVHNPKKGLILQGKRQRMIPLTEAAQECRDRIIHDRTDEDPFFVPANRSWWGHHFVRVARRAGVEEGTFNSLRHTFISRAANSGNIPIDVVRSWAGHRYLKTTQNYLHTIPELEHQYVQQLKI